MINYARRRKDIKATVQDIRAANIQEDSENDTEPKSPTLCELQAFDSGSQVMDFSSGNLSRIKFALIAP